MRIEKSEEILSTKHLQDTQLQIIKDSSYPNYVKASAGTGKTEILTRKVIQILENNRIDLNHIAIITFTNKATAELRNRLTTLLYAKWRLHLEAQSRYQEYFRLQAERVSMVSISTIHGFCTSLLRKYGIYVGLSPEFVVGTANKFLNRTMEEVIGKNHDAPMMKGISGAKMIALMRDFLRYCSTHGIQITDEFMEKNLTNLHFWKDFKPWFLNMANEIQDKVSAYKLEHNILSIDDLIHRTAELLDDDKICGQICKEYQYILIDEFQDTDPWQSSIVNKLIDRGVNVFLVGDEQQAIYSFRGADINSSYEMSKRIAESNPKRDFKLTENFRSNTSLLSIYNKIFSSEFYCYEERLSFPFVSLQKPAKMNRSEPHAFQIEYGLSVDKIVQNLLQQTLFDRPVRYSDITILCRQNYEVMRCAEALKKAGIPIQIVAGRGFYEAKEIIDMDKLLRAALISSPLHLTELMYTDYYSIMGEEKLKGFLSELHILSKEQSVEDLLYYIIENSGIIQFYAAEKRFQGVANLYKLQDMARDEACGLTQPLAFLAFLDQMIATKQEEPEAEVEIEDSSEGVVSLYTIHGAKGLAFNIVIYPFADTNLLRRSFAEKFVLQDDRLGLDSSFLQSNNHNIPEDPAYTNMISKEKIRYLEEELRIVYVCLTRARERIVISCRNSKDSVRQAIPSENYISPAKWILEGLKK